MTFQKDKKMKQFNDYEIDLVLYDEVEVFKQSKSSLFNYPFDDRKSKLGRMSFTAALPTSDNKYTRSDPYDYWYNYHTINF